MSGTSGGGSRTWGIVLSGALTSIAMIFLVAVLDESKNIDNPLPVVVIGAGAAIFFGILRGPIGKAIGRMLEGDPVSEHQLSERVEHVEDRVYELSQDQQRIAELEDRIAFAERLLADRAEQRLPGGGA